MGKRIALINCINPQHQDSTPSMAVYEHPRKGGSGQDKLQVFCFGCKFHAWVTPDQIDLKPKEDIPGFKPKYEVQHADHTELITQFFLDRNFKKEDIPWSSLEMGNEVHPLPSPLGDTPGTIKPVLRQSSRPYMEWNLYDYKFNVVGKQRRYLDAKQPKTRYIQVGELPYPQIAHLSKHWFGDYEHDVRNLHLCESWVDAVWVSRQLKQPAMDRDWETHLPVYT